MPWFNVSINFPKKNSICLALHCCSWLLGFLAGSIQASLNLCWSVKKSLFFLFTHVAALLKKAYALQEAYAFSSLTFAALSKRLMLSKRLTFFLHSHFCCSLTKSYANSSLSCSQGVLERLSSDTMTKIEKKKNEAEDFLCLLFSKLKRKKMEQRTSSAYFSLQIT